MAGHCMHADLKRLMMRLARFYLWNKLFPLTIKEKIAMFGQKLNKLLFTGLIISKNYIQIGQYRGCL